MSERLPWDRYWRRVTDPRPLPCDERGYLKQPTPDVSTPHVADALLLGGLEDAACLVLLGEPGAGKSDALTTVFSKLSAEPTSTQNWLFVDLSLISSDRALERKILNTPEYQNWLENGKELSLWLDGLDEAIAQFPAVATHLADELSGGHAGRLKLRISCRSADMPAYFVNKLRELWPNGLAELELLPLRFADVRMAAERAGVDPGSFYEAMSRTHTHGFATKPITLFMLLARYQRDGDLPSSLTELYEAGVLKLCEESNEQRALIDKGQLSPARRKLIVAGRVAAMQQFGNRHSISRADSATNDSTILAPSEVVGHSEVDRGQEFDVTDALVEEVLKTGLFKLRDDSLLAWVHQTYAEFLAAWYLNHRGVSQSTAVSWIRHQDEPEHIIPSLRGVAAWLGSFYPEVFEFVLSVEPEILTKGDISALSNEQRTRIVNKVLADLESDRVFTESEMLPRLSELGYSGLSELLKEVIEDRGKKERTREFALRLAARCGLSSLQETCRAIALEVGEHFGVRATACKVVETVGDEETRRTMLPLISEIVEEDAGEDLKGNALFALWPDLITPEQLFGVLTPPRSQSFHGSYWVFLHHLTERLHERPDAVAPGLLWIAESDQSAREDFSIGDICGLLIAYAFQMLHVPEIRESLSSLIPVLIRDHQGRFLQPGAELVAEQWKSAPETRLQLAEAVVRKSDPKGLGYVMILHDEPILITPDDLAWLVEKYELESDNGDRTKWVDLIGRCYRHSREDHKELLWPLAGESNELGDHLRPYFWVDLGSSLAGELKQRHATLLENQQRRNELKASWKKPLDPPIAVRIESRVAKAEAGDLSGFWALHRELTLVEGNQNYGPYTYLDLRITPGWMSASQELRARILDVAQRYVSGFDLTNIGWSLEELKTNSSPALAGCRALELLRTERPEVFTSLSAEVWTKWVGPLIAFPLTKNHIRIPSERSPDWQKDELPLIDHAFQKCPSAMLSMLKVRMLAEDAGGQTMWAAAKVQHIWNQEISELFIELVESKSVSTKATRALLGDVFVHDPARALAHAIPMLKEGIPSGDDEKLRFLGLVQCCAWHNSRETWPHIWAAYRDAGEVLSSLLMELGGRFFRDRDGAEFASHISDSDLAELCERLLVLYPSEGDPKVDGAHTVGPREQLAYWRDHLLSALKGRGTPEARSAVAELAEHYPKEPNLRWLKVAADEVALSKSWEPIHPRDFLEAVLDADRSLARNTDELGALVLEALLSIGAEQFQGKTPQAFSVWDEQKVEVKADPPKGDGSGAKVRKKTKSEFAPKSEEAFSDYLKGQLEHYLRGRGAIINREVEILRPQKGSPGQESDILVQIGRPLGSTQPEKLTVVIEVKGCWNPELKTAMKDQLVDRYLSGDKAFSEGIYVVGWFECAQWRAADYRRGNWQRHNLGSRDDAQVFFDEQARDLSDEGSQVRALVLDAGLP